MEQPMVVTPLSSPVVPPNHQSLDREPSFLVKVSLHRTHHCCLIAMFHASQCSSAFDLNL